jgi:hypothetical protein
LELTPVEESVIKRGAELGPVHRHRDDGASEQTEAGQLENSMNFAQAKGQESVERALEIAAGPQPGWGWHSSRSDRIRKCPPFPFPSRRSVFLTDFITG